MSELSKLIVDKKKICVMPEKQFRKLPGEYEEITIKVSYGEQITAVICHRSKLNGKLYILPDEFEKIPEALVCLLNVKDIRPSAVQQKSGSKATVPQQQIKANAANRRVVVEQEEKLRIMREETRIIPAYIKLQPAGSRKAQKVSGYRDVAGSNFYLSIDVYNLLSAHMRTQLDIQNVDGLSKDQAAPKERQHSRQKERALYSGKVIITDNSLLQRCKRIRLSVAGKEYPVTGYISAATGSLLVPAKNFSKEIPCEIRESLNWEDPRGYLLQYERKAETSLGKWEGFNAQSILHRYGYSVKNSVTRDDRQRVLGNVIRDKVISKEKTISHIRSLISRNKNRYPAACLRWQEDIEYVKQLSDPE